MRLEFLLFFLVVYELSVDVFLEYATVQWEINQFAERGSEDLDVAFL